MRIMGNARKSVFDLEMKKYVNWGEHNAAFDNLFEQSLSCSNL